MAWTPGLFTVLLVFATGILALLAISVWRRRGRQATPFVILMLTVATWAGLYSLQLGFTTSAEQLPWQAAALCVSATVPVAFLAFSYDYAGTWDRLAGWPLRLATGEALVFGAILITNPWHHFIWTAATIRGDGSPVLALDFSFGYAIHIVIAYAIVALALWALLSVYFRSSAIYRNQTLLLILGALPAFSCHILWTLKASPIAGLDLTPFAFVLTGGSFGAALFQFDLLDRTPIAQEHAIELTGDGLLVVDTEGMIVDSNPIARQVFDFNLEDRTYISMITDTSSVRDLDGETLTATVADGRRTYDIFVSELPPNSAQHAGFSLVLRDVTDREAYEQRLEVAYRVLRHNLRNDMTVIMGRAEILEELARTDEQATHAKTIQSTGEDLISLSKKARRMVELQDGARAQTETVDIRSVLEEVGSGFRTAYPSVPLTVSCPDEATVTVLSLGIAWP